MIGRYSRKVANDIVQECDLALVIGCRLGGLVSNSWKVPPPSTRILHVDVDTNVLGATYREEISVQGDAKLTLQALVKEATHRSLSGERTAWARQATERVQAWKEEVQRLASRSPEEPIHPAVVMNSLRAALNPTDIVQQAHWAGRSRLRWERPSARQDVTLRASREMGGLGII